MVNVGLLGMGMMGGFHAARYLQIPEAKLVAVADVRSERLEDEEAVAGNLPDQTAPVDLSSVAGYTDGSRLIAEAAEKADRLLMIGQCIRFWPEYRFLRQAVREGRFGEFLSLALPRMGALTSCRR